MYNFSTHNWCLDEATSEESTHTNELLPKITMVTVIAQLIIIIQLSNTHKWLFELKKLNINLHSDVILRKGLGNLPYITGTKCVSSPKGVLTFIHVLYCAEDENPRAAEKKTPQDY